MIWHERRLSWPRVGNHSEYWIVGDEWGWASRLAVQEGSSKDPVMLVWTSFLAAPFGKKFHGRPSWESPLVWLPWPVHDRECREAGHTTRSRRGRVRLTASELGLPFWSALGCFLPSLAPVTVEGCGEGVVVSGRVLQGRVVNAVFGDVVGCGCCFVFLLLLLLPFLLLLFSFSCLFCCCRGRRRCCCETAVAFVVVVVVVVVVEFRDFRV